MSMRYEVPLAPIKKYQHEVSVGLDFKRSENNLFFNELSSGNTPTEIFQVAAGYSAVVPDAAGRTSFSVQGYYSPGGVTDLDTDDAYNAARTGAKANYVYARANIERATRLPGDFSWIIRGIGQIADHNLLPSEQLGLGGYATARGYDERESAGDRAWFISNELRTPAFSVFRFLNKSEAIDEKLQLLAFWDYGATQPKSPETSEDKYILFSSVGAGLRYSFTRHFALRFDYGWQLRDSGAVGASTHDSRGHIGVVATY
jgi:hemolysin activation/secretion protein